MSRLKISLPLSANKFSVGIKFYTFRNVSEHWVSSWGTSYLFKMHLSRLIKLGRGSLLLNHFCRGFINLMLLCHKIFWTFYSIHCMKRNKISKMNRLNKMMKILILMRNSVLINYKVYFKYFINVRWRLKGTIIIRIRCGLSLQCLVMKTILVLTNFLILLLKQL